ncbi:1006_t:CDS:2, partial [Acaulospora morrowiae]
MKLWDSLEFSDQGTMDDKSFFDGFFKLSKTQRLYGFGICFAAGFAISIISTIALIRGDVVLFAIFYTIGNIISFLSTGFLVGFGKQFKTMFAPVRWIASAIVLVVIALTLVVAFWLKSGILCLILCIIQFMALFWY